MVSGQRIESPVPLPNSELRVQPQIVGCVWDVRCSASRPADAVPELLCRRERVSPALRSSFQRASLARARRCRIGVGDNVFLLRARDAQARAASRARSCAPPAPVPGDASTLHFLNRRASRGWPLSRSPRFATHLVRFFALLYAMSLTAWLRASVSFMPIVPAMRVVKPTSRLSFHRVAVIARKSAKVPRRPAGGFFHGRPALRYAGSQRTSSGSTHQP